MIIPLAFLARTETSHQRRRNLLYIYRDISCHLSLTSLATISRLHFHPRTCHFQSQPGIRSIRHDNIARTLPMQAAALEQSLWSSAKLQTTDVIGNIEWLSCSPVSNRFSSSRFLDSDDLVLPIFDSNITCSPMHRDHLKK